MGSDDSDEICIVCDGVVFFVKNSDWGKLTPLARGKLTPENPIENLIIFRAWMSMSLGMVILGIYQNLKIIGSSRKRNTVHSYDVINFSFYNLPLNRYALSHDHDFSTPVILGL